jgi:hypothetical protein
MRPRAAVAASAPLARFTVTSTARLLVGAVPRVFGCWNVASILRVLGCLERFEV